MCVWFHPSIHPSTTASSPHRVAEGLGPFQAMPLGQGRVYTLDKSPVFEQGCPVTFKPGNPAVPPICCEHSRHCFSRNPSRLECDGVSRLAVVLFTWQAPSDVLQAKRNSSEHPVDFCAGGFHTFQQSLYSSSSSCSSQ